MANKIFSDYSKHRINLFKTRYGYNSNYNVILGDFGEILAVDFLERNEFDVYRAEADFFDTKNYDNKILPNHFLYRPEINTYKAIDKYIERLHMTHDRTLYNYSQWVSYPGRLDFVAEKKGAIYFFDAKVNTSRLNYWQKTRIIQLCESGISAKVIRINTEFYKIDEGKGKKNINKIVKIPFRKNFALGIIRKSILEINNGKRKYLIDIPESKKMISKLYLSNQIEEIDYNIDFEDIKY